MSSLPSPGSGGDGQSVGGQVWRGPPRRWLLPQPWSRGSRCGSCAARCGRCWRASEVGAGAGAGRGVGRAGCPLAEASLCRYRGRTGRGPRAVRAAAFLGRARYGRGASGRRPGWGPGWAVAWAGVPGAGEPQGSEPHSRARSPQVSGQGLRSAPGCGRWQSRAGIEQWLRLELQSLWTLLKPRDDLGEDAVGQEAEGGRGYHY